MKKDKQPSINEKYLDALRTFETWVTISEWAVKFSEIYPNQLVKAERQASEQKNETTGLREITARISSQVSKNCFNGQVEEDRSERPRKVRWLNKAQSKLNIQKEIEEDVEPLTRRQKEKEQFDNLSTKEKFRMTELEEIVRQLNRFFGTDFEFEHAHALLNTLAPGSHHPNNIQILTRSHNRMKSGNNWTRFDLGEQISYITSIINTQKMISKKMNIDIQEEVLDLILDRLSKVY